MEGITLFISIVMIGVAIYFLQLPMKIYRHSKDVLWIWPLLIIGCYMLIKYLCDILIQYEPYPHLGNYILISIPVIWGYFFLSIRISKLLFKSKKFKEEDALIKVRNLIEPIVVCRSILEFLTTLAIAGCITIFCPREVGYISGCVLVLFGMTRAMIMEQERKTQSLQQLCDFVPDYAEKLRELDNKYKSIHDDDLPTEMYDNNNKYICSSYTLSRYRSFSSGNNTGGLKWTTLYFALLVAISISLLCFGETQTSTIYVSTSDYAKTYHYDKNCSGLKNAKSKIETISLDELDYYQYYDVLYDSYEDRTPCKICSPSE